MWTFLIILIVIIGIFVIAHYTTLTELDKETIQGAGGLLHVDGLDLPKNVKCWMRVTKERIIINDKEVIKSIDLVEKERNIVGRAIAGGVVFGGLGAIVSGMTGLKNDTVTQDVEIMMINYKNIDGNNSQIVFMVTNAIQGELMKKTSRKINELIGYASNNSPKELYEI
jgi:hypothetical protein